MVHNAVGFTCLKISFFLTIVFVMNVFVAHKETFFSILLFFYFLDFS